MKKTTILMMTLLALSSCAVEESPTGTPVPTKDEMPVRMTYDRMWEYSAHGESEDSEYIREILEMIRSFQTGEESQTMTEDFTDVIIFFYADDSLIRYEFEESNLVEDGKRYRVEGDLSGLRKLLERSLGEGR